MVNKKAVKTALVLGISGQDGSLLATSLLKEGWRVVGGTRRGIVNKYWRLDELGIFDQVELVNINLQEPHMVLDIVRELQPNHIYHLAGESFVEDSFHLPRVTMEANYFGTLNLLEAIRTSSSETRLFFASSSEVFGSTVSKEALDEKTPFRPINPYGISKLAAQQLVEIYRERYGLYALSGIMFNHEGPMRARNFVTRKISFNLARLKMEGGTPMQLGNFDAARDWGLASDYTMVMPEVLELKEAQDFVFATGKLSTVREFLSLAAEAVGFVPVFEGKGLFSVCLDRSSGLKLAEVSEKYFRNFDTPPHKGSPARLLKMTKFSGSHDVSVIATQMIEADLHRRKIGHVDV
ncbi:GDP-mannose 4,6-dehydratase [Kiloniella antarctica]|uniref:GDP-mannose 4,6-dehydratase n=1 Tax=Kiloniella antarctica TaxID=1550907 RepID=A0ABW5BSU1_9PROT